MQMQNNVITDDSASQENMHSTWGKTSFTSSVPLFLNLDFIIEAQIQEPKAAHTKFSLIKNMHFHLFIGYNNISVIFFCHC